MVLAKLVTLLDSLNSSGVHLTLYLLGSLVTTSETLLLGILQSGIHKYLAL